MNDAIDKYCGSAWSGNCIQAGALVRMKNTPEAVAANDLWYYPNREITWPDKLPNGMTFTAEEAIRAGELRPAIATYVDEMAIRFITGMADFNTWDSYVAQVNSMGLPELIGIYQAAYDRYMVR